MVKRTWWAAILLTILMFLSSVSTVFAATSTNSFITWPAKTTTDVNKAWTITFNIPLQGASVNTNTIYVEDSKQVKVAATIKLSADGLSTVITPIRPYTVGNYSLFITNGVTSITGKKIVNQILVPFTVVDTNTTNTQTSNYILDVQSLYNSFITNFKVTTSSNVYRVDMNKVKMRYIGKNTYSSGLYGVKQGSTITFQAYDQNNKLLQTYTYQL